MSYSPHQIDAALFATSSPLSKGAILADEVGLGKTIEAGLLEAKSYRQAIKEGATNPFDLAGNSATVLICSYQFAAGKAKDVQSVPWDLVVIDEAHRLRNVYKPENKTAHKPASFDWFGRFGIPAKAPEIVKPAQTVEPVSAEPLNQPEWGNTRAAVPEEPGEKKSKLACVTCGTIVAYNIAKFCWFNKPRFGGNVYCMDCQKAVPKPA